ncbi:MAG: UDP-glucose--dolichyl-phosphate glucosyltransferase [Acidocella sp. 20-57-95]|nr:MAG: UDP-glucose--dolichyl-phosphate glucosyltransferase [Acidocella sp. 20-57-95]HQT65761.1 glycosyltransferase family 2 protein [Acidocella sp.]HQU05186.1 glycosyltransferase family 2 protein [Acidocella sp.]
MPGVAVVIPTLNEAEAIAAVINELPRDIAVDIIIADSGSTDGTQAVARNAGARVVELGQRGYGKACAAGAAAAMPGCDIIVFMDGDGADRGDLLAQLVMPIETGMADFVIASRVKKLRERGSMSAHQVFAGWLLGLGIGALTGTRYHDMCAYRAIRRTALDALNMREMTYGWNIEMQIKAAQAGLRIQEIPLPYRCRSGGTSKVAGSLRGTIRASWRIIATFVRVARSGSVAVTKP